MHYKKIVKKSWKLTGYGYGKSLAIFVVNKAFYNKKTWLYSIGLNTAKNNQDYTLWSGIDGLDVGNSRRVGKRKKSYDEQWMPWSNCEQSRKKWNAFLKGIKCDVWKFFIYQ